MIQCGQGRKRWSSAVVKTAYPPWWLNEKKSIKLAFILVVTLISSNVLFNSACAYDDGSVPPPSELTLMLLIVT